MGPIHAKNRKEASNDPAHENSCPQQGGMKKGGWTCSDLQIFGCCCGQECPRAGRVVGSRISDFGFPAPRLRLFTVLLPLRDYTPFLAYPLYLQDGYTTIS